jgi:tRNA pseudouridine13 synthase
MKIKQRAEDFRVRELLVPGTLAERGRYRVYRVTKRKLTSLQAAEILAREARRAAGEVSMCGLKDRQGVTTQFMALEQGRDVSLSGHDLRIESAGFSQQPLAAGASEGNGFEIVVRGLEREDIATLRRNVPLLRDGGAIHYFDEQRFGNLRHGQGWIALDLIRGEHERALKTLLAARSVHDDPKTRHFKDALEREWGDWAACRDVAGRFGQHHSVFEHLKKEPGDFAGAFEHVAARLRLIHLYAYQSHLWNRAVVELVRRRVPPEQRVVIESREGPLVYPGGRGDLAVAPDATFRLPGPRLEDVADALQRELLADALAVDRLVPAQFAIEGVPGFQLKGEDRPLLVFPRHLRVRPPERDPLNEGLALVHVRFELPRGAYATLIVARLMTEPGAARVSAAEPPPRTHARRPAHEAPRSERAPTRSARGSGQRAAPCRGERRGGRGRGESGRRGRDAKERDR